MQDLPLLRRGIGKVGFKIAGNGVKYIHGNENFLIFQFGKGAKYENDHLKSRQQNLTRFDKIQIRFFSVIVIQHPAPDIPF